VNGSGFVPGSLVRWNGSPRQTSFVTDAQLTAQITASDIASIGTATITVFNSTPGGGGQMGLTSLRLPSDQRPASGDHQHHTPTTVNSGGQGFTLAVEGNNFTPTSVVQFNSDTRPTRFISANQLTADITEADILIGGSATINVFKPAPRRGNFERSYSDDSQWGSHDLQHCSHQDWDRKRHHDGYSQWFETSLPASW
jgi:hypothetical protein